MPNQDFFILSSIKDLVSRFQIHLYQTSISDLCSEEVPRSPVSFHKEKDNHRYLLLLLLLLLLSRFSRSEEHTSELQSQR